MLASGCDRECQSPTIATRASYSLTVGMPRVVLQTGPCGLLTGKDGLGLTASQGHGHRGPAQDWYSLVGEQEPTGCQPVRQPWVSLAAM